ncbi:MAG TPA: geranylgeranylglyceryl/heptaprenylglyceryl phosphate synthase [Bacteroidales bacterium]|nr:geranylgeranylglyceryl/heptaprenylglyceryl phosphate synthase [Bacteroidales bacterium]
MIYNTVSTPGRKTISLLIDPEKQPVASLDKTLAVAEKSMVDLILVGGSLTSLPVTDFITELKAHSNIPVLLFPGNLMQLSDKADGILLLSLISGRNPELLIGNHVMASRFLKKSGMEIIPTGYILIGADIRTSVAYMSNTIPIPAQKSDIITATAIAGEQLGMKLIYLEAGSGAKEMVSPEVITEVKRNISIPLWVGGGIRSRHDVQKLYAAGADGVVVGTAVEEDYENLIRLAEVRKEFTW